MANHPIEPVNKPAESAAMTQNVEQKTLTKDEIQKAVDEYTRLSNELNNPMLDDATREAKRKRQDEIHNLFKNSTQGLNALSDAIKASNKPSKDTSEKSEPIQVASSDETRKVPEKDKKLQQTFEEFRDEASRALNEKLFSNGKANIQSFKEAMQMAMELSVLKLPKEIQNIEKNEQKELQNRMPAVRGIVGAAFVDVLLKNNYTFVLNSNGTITLGYIQGRSTSDLLDAKQLNSLLNGEEGGKPFQELLHAGLLFHSGDLTKYAQLHSDANGVINDPSKTTYKNFNAYLDTLVGKSDDSQAAHILRSMNKGMDDKQFAEYLAATKYVPELTQNARAIEQAMQGVGGASAVANRADATWNDTYNSQDRHMNYAKVKAKWKEGGVGAMLGEAGATFFQGVENIAKYGPGAVIATLVLSWAIGKAIGKKGAGWLTLAGLITTAGIADRYGEYDLNNPEHQAYLRVVEKVNKAVTKEDVDNFHKEVAAQVNEGKDESQQINLDEVTKEQIDSFNQYTLGQMDQAISKDTKPNGMRQEHFDALKAGTPLGDFMRAKHARLMEKFNEEIKGKNLTEAQIQQALNATTMEYATNLSVINPEKLEQIKQQAAAETGSQTPASTIPPASTNSGGSEGATADNNGMPWGKIGAGTVVAIDAVANKGRLTKATVGGVAGGVTGAVGGLVKGPVAGYAKGGVTGAVGGLVKGSVVGLGKGAWEGAKDGWGRKEAQASPSAQQSSPSTQSSVLSKGKEKAKNATDALKSWWNNKEIKDMTLQDFEEGAKQKPGESTTKYAERINKTKQHLEDELQKLGPKKSITDPNSPKGKKNKKHNDLIDDLNNKLAKLDPHLDEIKLRGEARLFANRDLRNDLMQDYELDKKYKEEANKKTRNQPHDAEFLRQMDETVNGKTKIEYVRERLAVTSDISVIYSNAIEQRKLNGVQKLQYNNKIEELKKLQNQDLGVTTNKQKFDQLIDEITDILYPPNTGIKPGHVQNFKSALRSALVNNGKVIEHVTSGLGKFIKAVV